MENEWEKDKVVPYMPGMGWRIMDVIDPDNEVKKLLESIEMQDYFFYLDDVLNEKEINNNGNSTKSR